MNSEVSQNQPEELTEQMSSEMSLDQHMHLTKEEEDQDNLIMIGGIEIFLPLSLEETEVCIVDAATAEEQSAMTVKKEELE